MEMNCKLIGNSARLAMTWCCLMVWRISAKLETKLPCFISTTFDYKFFIVIVVVKPLLTLFLLLINPMIFGAYNQVAKSQPSFHEKRTMRKKTLLHLNLYFCVKCVNLFRLYQFTWILNLKIEIYFWTLRHCFR